MRRNDYLVLQSKIPPKTITPVCVGEAYKPEQCQAHVFIFAFHTDVVDLWSDPEFVFAALACNRRNTQAVLELAPLSA